jgi:ADP-ribose pyrophosphatase YjhB (NUDIX family)
LILPNEELVNAVVRALLEEISLTLSHDDFTMMSDAPVRVALPEMQRQLVCVFSACVPIPYVTTSLHTHAKVEQAVTAQSTINPDGSYVVPSMLTLTVYLLRRPSMGYL